MQPLFHPSFGKISYLVQSDAALMSFSLKNPMIMVQLLIEISINGEFLQFLPFHPLI